MNPLFVAAPSARARVRPILGYARRFSRSAALLASALGVVSAAAQSTPPPSSQPDEVLKLSPFQVSAKGDRGYGVTNSIGASRINLPVEDISTAVATLNRTFQDDIGAANLVEAIKYVSGVDMAAPLAEQWSIRGSGTSLSMLDGVPDPSGSRERYDPWLSATRWLSPWARGNRSGWTRMSPVR